jgi:fibronectin type 3 domain-containing protein
VDTPTYSDRNIEHGKTYRYEVTAIDRLGNESPHSAPTEAAFQ